MAELQIGEDRAFQRLREDGPWSVLISDDQFIFENQVGEKITVDLLALPGGYEDSEWEISKSFTYSKPARPLYGPQGLGA
jgi:hypothetical protein